MATTTKTTTKIRDYELTILVKEDAPQDVIDGLTEKIKGYGEVVKFEDDGVKRLCYPIRNQERAHYLFYALELEDGVQAELAGSFNLNDDIMRYLLVRVSK